VFEGKEKANEVAAAVHKQIDDSGENKTGTVHTEIHEEKV
jgi:hypothetical protein